MAKMANVEAAGYRCHMIQRAARSIPIVERTDSSCLATGRGLGRISPDNGGARIKRHSLSSSSQDGQQEAITF
jgi:hypothetical protein